VLMILKAKQAENATREQAEHHSQMATKPIVLTAALRSVMSRILSYKKRLVVDVVDTIFLRL